MTRQVKAKREKLQHKVYRGLIIQFSIFLTLRSIDLGASLAVLENSWTHSAHWRGLNDTVFNSTNHASRNFNRRSINSRSILPRSIYNHLQGHVGNGDPRNVDPRNVVRLNGEHRNVNPPNIMPRRFDPGKSDPRRRRNINSRYAASISTEHCKHFDSWEKKQVDSKMYQFKVVLGLTILFNIISLGVFFTHLSFWIAALKTSYEAGIDYKMRVTRLAYNDLLSLSTAVIRDVPLSCLNVELLALRSGRDGLACVACIFAGKCPPDKYVADSLQLGKSLLYFYYFIMLINSLWKGVSGFYRLSRFKEFNLYHVRALAAIVFGFLYAITTFTPAMYMFIYRYFAIPGLNSPFLQDFAKKIVVIGTAIWITACSVVLCCPLLYVIRLNAD